MCLVPLAIPQTLCIDVPGISTNAVPIIIWPKSAQSSDGYCYCLALTQLFPGCNSFCEPVYQFTFDGNRLCLLYSDQDLQGGETLKVYFIYNNDFCHQRQCTVNSFIASYWFSRESKKDMAIKIIM